MILIIIFVFLMIALYLFKHFENRRNDRNWEHHEKRKEMFNELLEKLKDPASQTDKDKENI